MIETDALVIGAGPVGLFSVFELGLQGIAAHVVDVLDVPGGQCIELYPDKPIYDIPGVPRCTGRELTQNLLQQVEPFAPVFHLDQQVEALQRQSDGRWLLSTRNAQQTSQRFLARSVIIAAGVGAFVPKELRVEGLAPFAGTQLFYCPKPIEAFADKNVLIVGGEDDAVRAAIKLAQPGAAGSVTLLHRRDVLLASAADLAAFAALRAAGRIVFQTGQVSAAQISGTAQARLTGVVIDPPDGGQQTLALDILMVCQGISPKLGPLAHWGLALQRKQITVDTANFATSEAGVFAIGDVVDYPGKKKLIVSGFHEATLAAFAVAALLRPDAPHTLQYTTSSALLQQRLGVL
ncbi:MAG: NAD(P)/FAD-dependent oxidoreductase [Rhodoferax sp.]|nr:NAD(P)/FAD-dependent oxidoreductase [Rhodoferax sp.]